MNVIVLLKSSRYEIYHTINFKKMKNIINFDNANTLITNSKYHSYHCTTTAIFMPFIIKYENKMF